MRNSLVKIILISLVSLSLAGCTFIFQKGRRSDIKKIEELEKTQRMLQESLNKEIQNKQVSLEMMEKGLVITFLADVLFDSGKAKIKPETYAILDKVAGVLKENVPELSVGIEGHTDNQPIKFSGWKSNWELSTARALSVLHYLVDEKGISPDRVSAVGYGEYRPVDSNDTKAGRHLNRRVEIVILPKVTKVKQTKEVREVGDSGLKEPPENLK